MDSGCRALPCWTKQCARAENLCLCGNSQHGGKRFWRMDKRIAAFLSLMSGASYSFG